MVSGEEAIEMILVPDLNRHAGNLERSYAQGFRFFSSVSGKMVLFPELPMSALPTSKLCGFLIP
jgi:hypothetical protein